MQKRPAHPFTIHVAQDKHFRSTFSWSIRQRKAIGRHALTSYVTFEEARLAGKAVLDEMIASWTREALHSATA